jgi:hypothetical protein
MAGFVLAPRCVPDRSRPDGIGCSGLVPGPADGTRGHFELLYGMPGVSRACGGPLFGEDRRIRRKPKGTTERWEDGSETPDFAANALTARSRRSPRSAERMASESWPARRESVSESRSRFSTTPRVVVQADGPANTVRLET